MNNYIEVHRTHCCIYHGCKYGDVNCPVVFKKVEQEFPCEDCNEEKLRLESFGIESMKRWKLINEYMLISKFPYSFDGFIDFLILKIGEK